MTRKERGERKKKWDTWTEGSISSRPSPATRVVLGILFVCLFIGGNRRN